MDPGRGGSADQSGSNGGPLDAAGPGPHVDLLAVHSLSAGCCVVYVLVPEQRTSSRNSDGWSEKDVDNLRAACCIWLMCITPQTLADPSLHAGDTARAAKHAQYCLLQPAHVWRGTRWNAALHAVHSGRHRVQQHSCLSGETHITNIMYYSQGYQRMSDSWSDIATLVVAITASFITCFAFESITPAQ